ncbi:MAG: heat-inducible transcriptional repressor HrcA [Pseudanabaenaceae cyanobacterium]
MKPNLTEREQKILWATVERYIATAEPVGSKTLLQEYNFDISSATIRSVLNALDRWGLLYQPHTSAGRVPSDSGYRVYVDDLLPAPSYELKQEAQQAVSAIKPDRFVSLENILKGVAQILASLSGCMALVTAPNTQLMRIRYLQLVPIDQQKLMLIALSDSYHTASAIVDLPPTVDQELLDTELEILHNFLNTHLQGKKWSELGSSLQWSELDQQFQIYTELLTDSLKKLMTSQNLRGQIFISGLSELLRQPEFNQSQQVQGIVYLLESEQTYLLPVLEISATQQVTVKIGSEIGIAPLQNCALVWSNYFCDREPVGSVGVLSATRMNYQKAIVCVGVVADHLSTLVSHW